MKKFILIFLISLSCKAAIPEAKYNSAIGSYGWLNQIIFESRVDSVTNKPIIMVKWEVLLETGQVNKYCKRINLDDISLYQFFSGKGPQSLGYFFILWQFQLNSDDPWCAQ